jgi:hypothetical protein
MLTGGLYRSSMKAAVFAGALVPLVDTIPVLLAAKEAIGFDERDLVNLSPNRPRVNPSPPRGRR